MGVYGLESIGQLGLSIPEDIAVVCFDSRDVFRMIKPGITTIEQPIREMAKASIEMLINRIEGLADSSGGQRLIKNTRLIIRGST